MKLWQDAHVKTGHCRICPLHSRICIKIIKELLFQCFNVESVGAVLKNNMTNPTEFFYDDSISDEFCESILTLLGKEGQDNYAVIRGILA